MEIEKYLLNFIKSFEQHFTTIHIIFGLDSSLSRYGSTVTQLTQLNFVFANQSEYKRKQYDTVDAYTNRITILLQRIVLLRAYFMTKFVEVLNQSYRTINQSDEQYFWIEYKDTPIELSIEFILDKNWEDLAIVWIDGVKNYIHVDIFKDFFVSPDVYDYRYIMENATDFVMPFQSINGTKYLDIGYALYERLVGFYDTYDVNAPHTPDITQFAEVAQLFNIFTGMITHTEQMVTGGTKQPKTDEQIITAIDTEVKKIVVDDDLAKNIKINFEQLRKKSQ